MPDCRDYFKHLLESTYVSSMWNDELICKEMLSFMEKVISIIPDKLYRYRRLDNEGCNVKSFEKGTITLCKAKCFSDRYDSLIYVDVEKQLELMKEGFYKGLQDILECIKQKDPLVRPERATKLCYYIEQGMTEQEAIKRVVKEDYGGYLEEVEHDLKQRESRFRDSERTARIACFTESVQSKFMWDTYAGGYRGFALEYNLRDYFMRSLKYSNPSYVFPVIYTDERPDLTTDEANLYIITKAYERGQVKDLQFFSPFIYPNLLSPHKPFLYKDKEEYGHEREWRLLHYYEECTDDYMEISDRSCLKAIYYGPDITEEDYVKLHQIAIQKGIEEYRVSIDDNSRKYSLKISQPLQ